MALLETWRNLAYGDGLDDKKREELWSGYFQIEKGIYEQILSQPEQVITGTVKELAEKYNTEILIMTGFLDGINESLKGYENPIDTMEEDTEVKIEIDPEKLYYNMVEAKATWLYELPQWDAILTPEKRKELYKSQKASGTVRKAKKIFPNDPCPCGSGKKYKKCCGLKCAPVRTLPGRYFNVTVQILLVRRKCNILMGEENGSIYKLCAGL